MGHIIPGISDAALRFEPQVGVPFGPGQISIVDPVTGTPAPGVNLCGFIQNPVARKACELTANVLGVGPGSQSTVPRTCSDLQVWDPATQRCLDLTPDVTTPAEDPAGLPGASMHLSRPHQDTVPVRKVVERRKCNKWSVLGKDGWCHPKGTIANKMRAWPKPRRPLMTGGDLNCITKAARVATRLKATSKRLKKLGMIKEAIR